MIKWTRRNQLILFGCILFLANTSWACIKIYPKLDLPGSSFESHFFSLEDSDFGPVFNDNNEARIFFNAKENKWCALNDGTPDCKALNAGKDTNIFLTDNKTGRIIGLIKPGSRPGQLLLFSMKAPGTYDRSKPENGIDMSKPWLSLEPEIERGTGDSVTSRLTVRSLSRSGVSGQVTHQLAGSLREGGRIDYPRTRGAIAIGPREEPPRTSLAGNSVSYAGCRSQITPFNPSGPGAGAEAGTR